VAFGRKRVAVQEKSSVKSAAEPSAKFSTELAVEQAQRFREATDRIRERTDLAAKALGGLALTGLTAIGIAKIADVFPYPPGEWPYIVLLFIGFLGMLGGVALFTYRLWNVGEKVVLQPDPNLMTLNDEEKAQVRKLYGEFAELNDAPTLRAFVARAFRWQRIADSLRPGDDRAQLLRERAQLALSEALATETRAGMIVARMRATAVVKGPEAIIAYLFFFSGVLGFGIAADRLDSERTQRVTVAKSCADAVTAGAARNLPAICGTATKPQSTTPADVTSQGVVDIATALQKCLSAAQKANKPTATCQPLRAALVALAKEP